MKEVDSRQCFYCKSDEGRPRPIGDYIVQLKELKSKNGIVLVCQTCYLNKRKSKRIINEETMMMKLIDNLRKIFVGMCFLILLLSASMYAQGLPGPPGFPDSPDAAPIDGGLGLLAAAGGVYAWKKLRTSKIEKEEE